jgi:hypothetical protein
MKFKKDMPTLGLEPTRVPYMNTNILLYRLGY